MTDHTIDFYRANARRLIAEYDALDVSHLYKGIRLQPGALVLDIGAGSGRDAKHWADQGFEGIGLEPCNELREEAYFKNRLTCARWLFSIWTVQEWIRLPAAAREFDLIWACASLQHLTTPEIADVLRYIDRNLAAGGYLMISMRRPDPEPADARYVNPIDSADLRDMVQGAVGGVRLERARFEGRYHSALWRRT